MNIERLVEMTEARLDAETHEDLCNCPGFPGNCMTYGGVIPWAHSDVDRIIRRALEIMEEWTE